MTKSDKKNKKVKIPVFFQHQSGARTRVQMEKHPNLYSLIPQLVQCFQEGKRLLILPEDIYVRLCIDCGWKLVLRSGKIPESLLLILDSVPYKITVKRHSFDSPDLESLLTEK